MAVEMNRGARLYRNFSGFTKGNESHFEKVFNLEKTTSVGINPKI
jgi:PII-like signaling protein